MPAMPPVTGPGPGPRPRIAIVAQPEYFQFMYETDLDDLGEIRRFRHPMSRSPGDYQELLACDADINVVFRGEFLPDAVLKRLRGRRVALSSEPFPRLVDGRWRYTTDSLRRYLDFRAIRHKAFDHLYHYDAASLPLLERDGLGASGAFPFPVATSVYGPRPQPRRWDLFFIGRSTHHRERYFGVLKHRHEFLHVCHGIWGEPLVDLINASTISLNVHAEDEVSWEPRLQMLLACEAFVISETITPNRFLRPGTDFIAVSRPSEMADAVQHYLHHDAERQAIARTGRHRVLEVLDSRPAFAGLLGSIMSGEARRFEPGAGWAVMDQLSRARRVVGRVRRSLP